MKQYSKTSHPRSVQFESLEGRTLFASGLAGAYFARTNLTLAKFSRVDPTINLKWPSGTPASSLGNDGFSARWSGTVTPKYSDTHTFILSSSGGVRLWVNNVLIIDAWDIHTQQQDTGRIRLGAGKKYQIRIDYRTSGKNTPAIKLEWQSNRMVRSLVPQSRLAAASLDRVKPTSPLNLSTDYPDSTSCTIDWDASSDPSGVVAYDIYAGSSRIATTLANETIFTISTLTPGADYTFSVQAIDAAGNASPMASTLVSIPGPSNLPPVRIMPLGDSITESDTVVPSYRYYLWNDLEEADYNVDFVGSMTGVAHGSPMFPDFDQDHEGHTGWRADEVAANAAAWAQAAQPDIVLLHIGTNDILQGQSNSTTASDISNIIDALRSVNSDIIILLAQIIPDTGRESLVDDLNARIATLAGTMNTTNSPIILVDMNSALSESDLRDGVHPNSSGDRKMADTWYSALAPLLE